MASSVLAAAEKICIWRDEIGKVDQEAQIVMGSCNDILKSFPFILQAMRGLQRFLNRIVACSKLFYKDDLGWSGRGGPRKKEIIQEDIVSISCENNQGVDQEMRDQNVNISERKSTGLWQHKLRSYKCNHTCLSSCVILGKLLNFTESLFLHLLIRK